MLNQIFLEDVVGQRDLYTKRAVPLQSISQDVRSWEMKGVLSGVKTKSQWHALLLFSSDNNISLYVPSIGMGYYSVEKIRI